MERKVKNGKVVLNGTKPKWQVEQEIFDEFEEIQKIEEQLKIRIIDYFKIFRQKYIWSFNENFLPEQNRVVYVDNFLHKITLYNEVSLKTHNFHELNITWFFTKEDCLNKRNEVLESGKKSKNKE